MNVGKTTTIVHPVKPETTANDQKVKEAQQRQAQATAQETQKAREARPEQATTAGAINITV
jgi:Tfp pilus assembly protein PilN